MYIDMFRRRGQKPNPDRVALESWNSSSSTRDVSSVTSSSQAFSSAGEIHLYDCKNEERTLEMDKDMIIDISSADQISNHRVLSRSSSQGDRQGIDLESEAKDASEKDSQNDDINNDECEIQSGTISAGLRSWGAKDLDNKHMKTEDDNKENEQFSSSSKRAKLNTGMRSAEYNTSEIWSDGTADERAVSLTTHRDENYTMEVPHEISNNDLDYYARPQIQLMARLDTYDDLGDDSSVQKTTNLEVISLASRNGNSDSENNEDCQSINDVTPWELKNLQYNNNISSNNNLLNLPYVQNQTSESKRKRSANSRTNSRDQRRVSSEAETEKVKLEGDSNIHTADNDESLKTKTADSRRDESELTRDRAPDQTTTASEHGDAELLPAQPEEPRQDRRDGKILKRKSEIKRTFHVILMVVSVCSTVNSVIVQNNQRARIARLESQVDALTELLPNHIVSDPSFLSSFASEKPLSSKGQHILIDSTSSRQFLPWLRWLLRTMLRTKKKKIYRRDSAIKQLFRFIKLTLFDWTFPFVFQFFTWLASLALKIILFSVLILISVYIFIFYLTKRFTSESGSALSPAEMAVAAVSNLSTIGSVSSYILNLSSVQNHSPENNKNEIVSINDMSEENRSPKSEWRRIRETDEFNDVTVYETQPPPIRQQKHKTLRSAGQPSTDAPSPPIGIPTVKKTPVVKAAVSKPKSIGAQSQTRKFGSVSSTMNQQPEKAKTGPNRTGSMSGSIQLNRNSSAESPETVPLFPSMNYINESEFHSYPGLSTPDINNGPVPLSPDLAQNNSGTNSAPQSRTATKVPQAFYSTRLEMTDCIVPTNFSPQVPVSPPILDNNNQHQRFSQQYRSVPLNGGSYNRGARTSPLYDTGSDSASGHSVQQFSSRPLPQSRICWRS